MQNLTVTELVHRHRLSLAQIDRLNWAEVDRKDLLEEKVGALFKANQIKKALDQLRETQVFFICIKGFALSFRLYGDTTIRTARDLDILVLSRNDVEILRKKLLELGWTDSFENLWIDQKIRRDWYMDYIHHFSMLSPDGGLLLEIHWQLDYQFLLIDQIKLKKLVLENFQKIKVFDKEINILKPELEFLFLMVHGSRDGWYRLKWLVDIYDYPYEQINENQLFELLERFGLNHLLTQTNALLKIYFKRETPFKINQRINSFTIKYALRRIEGELWSDARSFCQLLKSEYYFFLLINKLSLVWRSLKRIHIRHQDFSEINLNARWKYFFYRYYSLFNRKILKKFVN